MKLLIDQNISKRIIESIQDVFPKSIHITDLKLGDASDIEVWEYALKNNFVLISTDIDVVDRCVISDKAPKTLFVKGDFLTTTKMEWALRINEDIIRNFYSDAPETCLQITV